MLVDGFTGCRFSGGDHGANCRRSQALSDVLIIIGMSEYIVICACPMSFSKSSSPSVSCARCFQPGVLLRVPDMQ